MIAKPAEDWVPCRRCGAPRRWRRTCQSCREVQDRRKASRQLSPSLLQRDRRDMA